MSCDSLRRPKLIEQRPAIVEQRVRVGDWEGDLITGRLNQSAIGTLVDRTSRYVRLIPLHDGHRAELLRDALIAGLADVPDAARRTLAWDQGSEMAMHDQIAPFFAEGVYFAKPASPWQRGTNENTNGLLRQYFPKGTNLALHTVDDLRAVEARLNNRPRKCLEWRTPAEVFAACMRS